MHTMFEAPPAEDIGDLTPDNTLSARIAALNYQGRHRHVEVLTGPAINRADVPCKLVALAHYCLEPTIDLEERIPGEAATRRIVMPRHEQVAAGSPLPWRKPEAAIALEQAAARAALVEHDQRKSRIADLLQPLLSALHTLRGGAR